ncbi:unnamed protein product [Rotaria sp. Silwood1]
MPTFYRFINQSERKRLWSIVLFEIALVTLTWYYIEKIQLNNECYKTLKQDYHFISLYIDVPHHCTWWSLLWFWINRYTIYAAYIVFIYILLDYYISSCYMFGHTYIWTGLVYNIVQAKQEDSFFYRDAPILFHTLIIVLYLENQPFLDADMQKRWIEIKMENEERSFAQEEAESQCWAEAIHKIRQYDDADEIKQIIRQADDKEEKIRARYPLLAYPVLPPLEQKNNILLSIFTRITTFLLCILAVWNYVLLFRRAFVITFSQRNTTHTL